MKIKTNDGQLQLTFSTEKEFSYGIKVLFSFYAFIGTNEDGVYIDIDLEEEKVVKVFGVLPKEGSEPHLKTVQESLNNCGINYNFLDQVLEFKSEWASSKDVKELLIVKAKKWSQQIK